MEEVRMGWICPICKNGVAPAEKLCPHCIPVEKIKSLYPGLKEEKRMWIGDPMYPHDQYGWWERNGAEWIYREEFH